MAKVAIVEDNHSIAAMYQFKLELNGYLVKLAYNGVDGLAMIKDFKPDVILLDLKMPSMDGVTMLEKLRSTLWGSTIRVIILTNISRSEAPPMLRFLNVDRYVVKAHTTPQQIQELVLEIIGR